MISINQKAFCSTCHSGPLSQSLCSAAAWTLWPDWRGTRRVRPVAPYPGVRPHPSQTGLSTAYPGTTDQGCMWTEFPVAEGDVWHIAVPFGIDSSGRNQEEKGQRTRALVFLAMGVVTTLQAQTDTLSIFENGIGALNLPLNATQLGTDNYRGVHPRTLSMAQGSSNQFWDNWSRSRARSCLPRRPKCAGPCYRPASLTWRVRPFPATVIPNGLLISPSAAAARHASSVDRRSFAAGWQTMTPAVPIATTSSNIRVR